MGLQQKHRVSLESVRYLIKRRGVDIGPYEILKGGFAQYMRPVRPTAVAPTLHNLLLYVRATGTSSVDEPVYIYTRGKNSVKDLS